MADSENEAAPAEKKSSPRWVWIAWSATALLLASIAIPVYSDGPSMSPLVRNRVGRTTIFLAVKMYAGDHDGRFPSSLRELVPQYLSEDDFENSAWLDTKSLRRYEWLYFPGATETSSSDTIILASPGIGGKRPSEYRVVIRADGSGSVLFEKRFRELRPDRPAAAKAP